MPMRSSTISRSSPWLSLPAGWDAGWNAARAAVGSSPAYVAVIGDSNAQGFASTDHQARAFPHLLRNTLVARYGSYGDYYPVLHSNRVQTILGGQAIAGTPLWTFDTTFGNGGGFTYNGFGGIVFQDGGTFPQAWVNAGSGVFVAPYATTMFDVIYHDNFTGTWKYNIDNAAGGALVTMTNDTRNSMRRLAVTGQANAIHTVRFGGGSAAYVLPLNGIVLYDVTSNKTRGIGFANVSCNGARAIDWAGSPNLLPADRIHQWQGRYKTAVGVESLTGFGFPTQPHLAIIELGINDASSSGGIVQFRTTLRRLVDALRRGQPTASILFVICPNPSVNSSDMSSQFLRAESWSLYADQIYGVSEEYQCAVYNAHAEWVPNSFTKGYTGSLDPHPIDAGHQRIADVLTAIIA